jgi:single-strand DNA-binding protein
MLMGFIAGTLGRDAELRDVGQSVVCSFSVAVEQRVKREKVVTWIRCSLWGKRGEALVPHLVKGSKVSISGTLTVGVYNGKPTVDLNVNEVTLMGRPKRAGGAGGSNEGAGDFGGGESSGGGSSAGGNGGYGDDDYGDGGDTDIPF